MSVSFLLKSGHRTVLSMFPEYFNLRNLAPDKYFHSICNNNLKLASRLMETTRPLINSLRGMKTKGKLNLRCKDCYFVTRQERRYVMCKTHGRHKQQAMVKKEENTWILTHATQSKRRPW